MESLREQSKSAALVPAIIHENARCLEPKKGPNQQIHSAEKYLCHTFQYDMHLESD